MTIFLVVIIALLFLVLIQINSIREELRIMAENIASLDLVKRLARAVIAAQESEADAEEARTIAAADLTDLRSQVTLDAEAEELISRALGNAIHAPAVPADPVVVPPTNDDTWAEQDGPAVPPAEPSLGDAVVDEDEVKPLPPSEQ